MFGINPLWSEKSLTSTGKTAAMLSDGEFVHVKVLDFATDRLRWLL